jgi:HPt (histidine-containing phosphotransfer) domain-containing protein
MSDSSADPLSPSPACDRHSLRLAVGGDESIVRELLELYRQESPKLRNAVQNALGKGDAELLRRAAHSLKGTLGSMCAHEASAAAEVLELIARSGELTAADVAFADLQRKLDRLAREIEQYLTERNSP